MKPPLINAETTAGPPGTKKLPLSETGGFLPGKNNVRTTAVSTAKNASVFLFKDETKALNMFCN